MPLFHFFSSKKKREQEVKKQQELADQLDQHSSAKKSETVSDKQVNQKSQPVSKKEDQRKDLFSGPLSRQAAKTDFSKSMDKVEKTKSTEESKDKTEAAKTSSKSNDSDKSRTSEPKGNKEKEKTDKKENKTTDKNSKESKEKDQKPKQKFSFAKPKDVSQPIIISFVAKGDEKIANDFTFTGKLGQKLSPEDLPAIKGYKLAKQNSLNYSIKKVSQHIKLHYVSDKVDFKVIAVDEGQKIIPNTPVKNLEGHPGDKVDPSLFVKIPGYRIATGKNYRVPKNGNDLRVTYILTYQQIHFVIQTTDGKTLQDFFKHGRLHDKYKIDLKQHAQPGYELDKVPNNGLSGTFPAKDSTIYIIYRPIKTKLTVKFLDESGNQVHEPKILHGHFQDSYSITLPPMNAYELSSEPDLLTGHYKQAEDEVILRFKRSTVSFKINLWFDKRHSQSAGKPIPVSGLVGAKYKYPIPQIDGYVAHPNIIEGTFQPNVANAEPKNVDVIYTKKECTVKLVFQDQKGHLIKGVEPIIQKGKWGEKYSIKLPHIDGFLQPDGNGYFKGQFTKPNEVNVVNYTPQTSTVVVNYINKHTNKPIPNYASETLTGYVNDTYHVDPKLVQGYSIQTLPENYKGIFTPNKQVVNLYYAPSPSRIVVHYFDTTYISLAKNKVIPGYFNKPFEIVPKHFAGYDYKNSSYDLKGTFPASKLDISLFYKPDRITFTLMPVDQFGKPLGQQYNVKVSGLVNNSYDVPLPDIPGYTSDGKKAGQITPDKNDKIYKVAYTPETQVITIHTIYGGGNNDGANVFNDDPIVGKTGAKYNYDVQKIKGYTPNTDKVSGIFTPETRDITVVYKVNKEDYVIRYIDENGKVVKETPKKHGYYDESINVNETAPFGFHLPDNQSQSISLSGKKVYKVKVNPDRLVMTLSPVDVDGDSLGAPNQVSGYYHEEQLIPVPDIQGYKPVNGDKIQVNFDPKHLHLNIKYAPEERQLTVQYLNTHGNSIRAPKIIKGHYQEDYTVDAPEIPNYVPVDSKTKRGTYGNDKDQNIFFIYQLGTDQLDGAVSSMKGQLKDTTHPTVQHQATAASPQKALATTPSESKPKASETQSNSQPVNSAKRTQQKSSPQSLQNQPKTTTSAKTSDLKTNSASMKSNQVSEKQTETQKKQQQGTTNKKQSNPSDEPKNLLNKIYSQN